MKFKNAILAAILGTSFSINAMAEDKPWTASFGLNYRDSNFNIPNNKFDNESWSTHLGLMRRLNDRTWVGGNIAYNNSNSNYKSINGEADVDTTSASAYIIRNIAWGLYANGSVGYGKSQIDTDLVNLRFNNDADFKTASLGLTQYLPITLNLMSSINVHYTHISSDVDSFITNLGTAVPSSNNTLNYVTLGGSLTYQINKWSPFVTLNWNKANREFINGTGDRDYFAYNVGTRYAMTSETSIAFTLGSVFNKRDINETSAGISLTQRF